MDETKPRFGTPVPQSPPASCGDQASASLLWEGGGGGTHQWGLWMTHACRPVSVREPIWHVTSPGRGQGQWGGRLPRGPPRPFSHTPPGPPAAPSMSRPHWAWPRKEPNPHLALPTEGTPHTGRPPLALGKESGLRASWRQMQPLSCPWHRAGGLALTKAHCHLHSPVRGTEDTRCLRCPLCMDPQGVLGRHRPNSGGICHPISKTLAQGGPLESGPHLRQREAAYSGQRA